ncbi:hypothetical protein [Sporosarcina sp. BP05]|uniref:hypothetical protein n=1 Tax=Sporosarcina sp. BP05 TaxID=2758726 RepID=UPI0016475E28|nr:hypothetical protein [Sporosarcina sp. BP05]
MTKRDALMETFRGLSNEKFLEFDLFLQEQFNSALENVDNAEWRVSFFTRAFESCETGEKFTFKRQHTGKPFTFDPNGEDKEGIASMLEEAKGDLIKGRKLLNLLSAFKDTFDNENN